MGVLPILLDLISDFKPTNFTFSREMADAVGLLEEDVDAMLRVVHDTEALKDEREMAEVRLAIQDHANQLKFLGGSSLYHTRMVNEIMQVLLNRKTREEWMKDIRNLPSEVTRESAPTAVYRLLEKSQICRDVAKSIVANKSFSTLFQELAFAC